jgi:alpha-glucosidase
VPWLPQPATWAGLSVRAQDADAASTLSLYRRARANRPPHPGLPAAASRWLDGPDGTLHFERGAGFRCLVNVSADPIPLSGVLLVRSDTPAAPGDVLSPGAAAWYRDPAGERPEAVRSLPAGRR